MEVMSSPHTTFPRLHPAADQPGPDATHMTHTTSPAQSKPPPLPPVPYAAWSGMNNDVALPGGKNQPTFVPKLLAMVTDPNVQTLIGWADDGEVFSVLNPSEFSRVVLPQYFKHNNWHSFVRQLNIYGFQRATEGSFQPGPHHDASSAWDFFHPFFKRDRPDLISNIKRRATVRTGDTVPSPSGIPSPNLAVTPTTSYFVPQSPYPDQQHLEAARVSPSNNGYSQHPREQSFGSQGSSLPSAPASATQYPQNGFPEAAVGQMPWLGPHYRPVVPGPAPLSEGSASPRVFPPQQSLVHAPLPAFFEDRFLALETNVRVLSTALYETQAEVDRSREQSYTLFKMCVELLGHIVESRGDWNYLATKRYELDSAREQVVQLDHDVKSREATRAAVISQPYAATQSAPYQNMPHHRGSAAHPHLSQPPINTTHSSPQASLGPSSHVTHRPTNVFPTTPNTGAGPSKLPGQDPWQQAYAAAALNAQKASTVPRTLSASSHSMPGAQLPTAATAPLSHSSSSTLSSSQSASRSSMPQHGSHRSRVDSQSPVTPMYESNMLSLQQREHHIHDFDDHHMDAKPFEHDPQDFHDVNETRYSSGRLKRRKVA